LYSEFERTREQLSQTDGASSTGTDGTDRVAAMPGVEVPAGSAGAAGETLTALLPEAIKRDMLEDFLETVATASRFRPLATGIDDRHATPRAITLASGLEQPCLICVPSILVTSGPYQYARLAKGFNGAREVSAVSLPGFGTGEPLPASLEVALQLLAAAVLRQAAERPYALVGHSTGGLVAYALAEHLFAGARPPTAVILLDTYGQSISADLMGKVFAAIADNDDRYGLITDAALTAMGAYGRLLAEWNVTEVSCPTLFLQASESLSGSGELSSWPLPHTALAAPGNHFTLMQEHASFVAQAIAEWLADGAAADGACSPTLSSVGSAEAPTSEVGGV
jgi:polyketide synthase 7